MPVASLRSSRSFTSRSPVSLASIGASSLVPDASLFVTPRRERRPAHVMREPMWRVGVNVNE
eukprot:scaffold21848_cov31-Tisochrysis_lutea.AAC.1